jgi:molybdate transport system ATP-binding protein
VSESVAPRAPAVDARFDLQVRSPRSVFQVCVEFRLDRGVLVLFGASGAGKTLTLEALAGLARPSHGFIRQGEVTLFDATSRVWLPPHTRRVGYAPQRQSLFPFLDVLGNVEFGLPRKERGRRGAGRSMVLLEELGIAHRARARPRDLSGGERQRVALARALNVEPKLLLLDEPFASIDRAGRATLCRTLRDILARRSTPAVLVTHDPLEAIEMGDRLVHLEEGRGTGTTTPSGFFGIETPMSIEYTRLWRG